MASTTALATYKDLCIDALDAEALGAFWGPLLGLEVESLDDGDIRLSGPTPRHAIWVNTVPEPVTVKQRAHLDVTSRVDQAESLGATVLDVQPHWTVMRDPEGGEFCLFPTAEPQTPRSIELVVDCGADAHPIAAWWADVLGLEALDHELGFSYVKGIPNCPLTALAFVPVPEPKTIKNRIHLDLYADVEELVARGASVVAVLEHWTVMADPDGNEFCAFKPR